MNTFISLVRDSLFSLIFHLAPRFANVLIFIFIGRLVGPNEAGIFTLATTYLLIFATTMRGIDDLVVREVSRTPGQALKYFANFFLLRLSMAVIMYGILWIVAGFLFDYEQKTTNTILILGLSVIPDSLTYMAQSIFLGLRQFKIPAIVFASTSLLKLMGGSIVLATGGQLTNIAWVWLLGSLLGMLVLVPSAIKKCEGSIFTIRKAQWLDSGLINSHKTEILTFFFLTTLTTIETQSDTIFLSRFHGETEVGWYGAATTVAYSLIMISQAYRFAVYPLMNRYALYNQGKLAQLYEQSLHYLLLLVLPMIVGIIILSEKFVPIIFGPDFQPTIKVLNILIVTLFFMFLNEPNVRLLLAFDQQKKILLFLLVSAGTNVLLNFLLTPSLGTEGAAIARVSSSFVLFSLNYIWVSRVFVSVNFSKLLPKPMIAVAAMTVIVMSLHKLPIIIPISFGCAAYLISLIVLGGIPKRDIQLLRQSLIKKIT